MLQGIILEVCSIGKCQSPRGQASESNMELVDVGLSKGPRKCTCISLCYSSSKECDLWMGFFQPQESTGFGQKGFGDPFELMH